MRMSFCRYVMPRSLPPSVCQVTTKSVTRRASSTFSGSSRQSAVQKEEIITEATLPYLQLPSAYRIHYLHHASAVNDAVANFGFTSFVPCSIMRWMTYEIDLIC